MTKTFTEKDHASFLARLDRLFEESEKIKAQIQAGQSELDGLIRMSEQGAPVCVDNHKKTTNTFKKQLRVMQNEMENLKAEWALQSRESLNNS